MWIIFVNFVGKTYEQMARIEKIDNVNDYVRYVGAEELHPHVAISIMTSWTACDTV